MKQNNINSKQFINFVNFCKDNKFLFDPSLTESQSNFINFYKKGNKIKIKEKNKGSFTRYCKGNVTEECIRRGKNSPSASIRKKAIFAANSRSWKLGGRIASKKLINFNNLFNNKNV